MPNRRLLKFLAVLARYEVKDFVFTSLDAQLLACSARVSLKSDSLLEKIEGFSEGVLSSIKNEHWVVAPRAFAAAKWSAHIA